MMIDANLVRLLVAAQFPKWKALPVYPVALSGWDNRTFHLGKDMLVRMPSAAEYALQVEKEHKWLPKLSSFLPLLIPEPLAIGKPAEGYPWNWSIYRWIEGETAAFAHINNLCSFAKNLAQFLIALQSIDSTGGPPPGPHSFYRGGLLTRYDVEVRKAIVVLKGQIDVAAAIEVWETALKTSWNKLPVWVHGDISAGNLLVKEGELSAVIDFGQLVIGDPACDLVIAWTFFKGESRKSFQEMFSLDAEVWARARAWVLWKALITAAGFSNPSNKESSKCWNIIEEVIKDHRTSSKS